MSSKQAVFPSDPGSRGSTLLISTEKSQLQADDPTHWNRGHTLPKAPDSHYKKYNQSVVRDCQAEWCIPLCHLRPPPHIFHKPFYSSMGCTLRNIIKITGKYETSHFRVAGYNFILCGLHKMKAFRFIHTTVCQMRVHHQQGKTFHIHLHHLNTSLLISHLFKLQILVIRDGVTGDHRHAIVPPFMVQIFTKNIVL